MDDQKLKAAEAALDYVEDGMKLGLGTGSTAEKFVDLLGKRVAEGLKVVGVPTSKATKEQAEKLGIPLTTLDGEPTLDLTIDGADEIDQDICLIKGGGGALLREKIVAMASERMVVIADQSKLVENLGAFPLPIEVVKFGLGATRDMIQKLSQEAGCTGEITLRKNANGEIFITDEGHYILDCAFNHIPSLEDLEDALTIVPGVVETGLFIDIADFVLIGTENGVEIIEAPDDEEYKA